MVVFSAVSFEVLRGVLHGFSSLSENGFDLKCVLLEVAAKAATRRHRLRQRPLMLASGAGFTSPRERSLPDMDREDDTW